MPKKTVNQQLVDKETAAEILLRAARLLGRFCQLREMEITVKEQMDDLVEKLINTGSIEIGSYFIGFYDVSGRGRYGGKKQLPYFLTSAYQGRWGKGYLNKEQKIRRINFNMHDEEVIKS
ncbi:MAG: hypothetical protein PVJ09_05590 [Candidatus Woesebacteria bacterium]|jgi:hypothetical protein